MSIDSLRQLHDRVIKHVDFQELEHIPTEFKPFQEEATVQDGCLLIGYDVFDKYYPLCMDLLKDQTSEEWLKRIASDLLLCLNGQNEKAWNFKRICKWTQDELRRELRLNAALCMKFKKSSILYEYRLQIIKRIDKIDAASCLQQEHAFMCRVFDRFPRNAFCWMYRLKLVQHLVSLDKTIPDIDNTFMQSYCQKNIHDYSAYWYRYNHIMRMSTKEAKMKDLQWCYNLIQFYGSAYMKSQQSSKLYTLHKYVEWLSK